jgi:hypothetical protein
MYFIDYLSNAEVKKERKVIARVKIKEKMICPQVVNVLINSALPKRYIRKSDQEFKIINTVSSAKIVIKITTIICIANFANKFTRTIAKTKMMISGLAVITVKGG